MVLVDPKHLFKFMKHLPYILSDNEDFTGPLVLEGSHGTYKEFEGPPLKPFSNESCPQMQLLRRRPGSHRRDYPIIL